MPADDRAYPAAPQRLLSPNARSPSAIVPVHWLEPRAVTSAVVGTITLTSVLIIYDGWASLRFVDVVAIIVGPVLAIFIVRAFGEALAKGAAQGSPLTRSELLGLVRAESSFLLLAVPPIMLLAVLGLAGVALDDSIQVVIWFGAASLGFWGGLAGVRAGLRGWRLALAVAIGFLVGGLVLTLRVILQPGKVVSNGVAAISPPLARGDRHSASHIGFCCVVRKDS